jgi:MFS family permease
MPSQTASAAAQQTHDAHHISPGDIATGVVIGRVSEFFDFSVYGIATVLVFPKLFFPFATPLDGTMYSFAVFSLAFVARPFGSLLFRMIHVWFGRGTRLLVALMALGTSTAGMAFLPGYDTIGGWAIAFLILLRIGQGIAVGGSWDGLPSLLALHAPANRRGWYAMIPQLGAPIGFLIASGLYAYMVGALDSTEFLDWGWRFGFFSAFAINVVAMFARLRMVVTPEFAELMKESALVPSPIGELFQLQGRNILLGSLAPLASYALFHLVTVFVLSWVELFGKISPVPFLTVQCVGSALAIVAMLISGVVADRIGRPRTLAIGAVLIALSSLLIPSMVKLGALGAEIFILLGFVLLGFSHGQAAGAVNSSFAPRFRYSGALVTSDFGWLLGAGFAPLIALWLSEHFGVGSVSLYLLSGSIGTLVALQLSKKMLTLAAEDQ